MNEHMLSPYSSMINSIIGGGSLTEVDIKKVATLPADELKKLMAGIKKTTGALDKFYLAVEKLFKQKSGAEQNQP